MTATVEIFGSAIVVIGSFNPAIFTPDWLEKHELIGSEDADKARQGAMVVAREAAQFETDWFVLQVTPEQFSITSNGALSPGLKDLAVGALTLLPHTPATAMGINFFAHYKLPTTADYHKVGDVLAPKDIWLAHFPGEDRSAGMVDVTIVIEPSKRGEKPKTPDKKRITVQPSSKVTNGIYFSYNDHHEVLPENKKRSTVEWCTKLIEEHWQAVWEDSKRVFDGILDSATKN